MRFVSRSNELNCDDPNFEVKSAFVIKIVSNHTETSLVYLLRSFKSKTNLSKPLFRFFDVEPLHTLLDVEFSPSSAFLVWLLSTAVVVAVAAASVISVDVFDAANVVKIHFLSKSSEQTGLPNVPSSLADFLVCQKSSLEQRQQRKRFSSFNGDSFVIGDTISGS